MRKSVVASKAFLGRCPRCRYILSGLNMVNFREPDKKKQKIECPRCLKIWRRPKLIVPRVRSDYRPARLPGFRRTRWGKDNSPQAVVDFFKHILVLPLPTAMVEARLAEYEKELIKDEGWSVEKVVAAQTAAAQQSLWSDSQYVKDRFEAIYMDKPLPMVISGRDARSLTR